MAGAIPLLGVGAGIASTLFGKPKGQAQQSSTSTQTSTPVDMQAQQYQALRDQFAAILSQQMTGGPSGFNPINAGPAPTAAMSAGEIAAMQGVSQQAFDPTRLAAISQFASGQNVNPYVQTAIDAAVQPLIMAQDRELGRRIPGAFAAAGHQMGQGGSSPYQRELGEAAYLSQRAIGDTAGTVGMQAFNQAQNAQLQGIQLGQQEVDQAVKAFQAQQLPRLIQQMGIDQGINAGQQQFQNWLQAMAQVFGASSPVIANLAQGTSQSSGTSTQQNNPFELIFPRGLFNPSPSNLGVTS